MSNQKTIPQKNTRLSADQLTRMIDIQQLPESTQNLKPSDLFLGQNRAKQAIEFAIHMPFNDYHLCAVGTHQLGKRYRIIHYLQQWIQSSTKNTLSDLIYVYSFNIQKPLQQLVVQHAHAYKIQQQFLLLWIQIIQLFKQHSKSDLAHIKQSIQPLFHDFYQKHQHLYHDSAAFESYLNHCCVHLCHHIQSMMEKFSKICPIHFNLNDLPEEYRIYIFTHQTDIPIIYESNPSPQRLFAQVSYKKSRVFIQAGHLLQANHGFLLIDLKNLIQHPTSYYLLKQCLANKKFEWSNFTTDPYYAQLESIPLQLKVILLCDSHEFDQILDIDPEFTSVFKIRADFTDSLLRTSEHELAYIHRVADLVHQHSMLHFDRTALAEILTESSRLAEDQNLLTLHDGQLQDLLYEGQYYALQNHANIVSAIHIQTALQQRHYRLGYWRDLYWQDLSQGTQLIETQGARLGQVNALSIIHFADTEFGIPSRLTASVSKGEGDILDIERSVELGGSLHAKGTLLMSSFLKAHFGRQQILNFSAALAFEQSYGEVDGDSATVAELCALISAISQIPIQQSWAITGSMNQLGQVQAVGGINAKIEGFFDTCKLQGLTGQQGVIIPHTNTQHLMLRQDIIQAIQDGLFHIHAIEHVEQALEILMNRPVGTLSKKGVYSTNSIYEAVMIQLAHWQNDLLLEEEPHKKKKTKK